MQRTEESRRAAEDRSDQFVACVMSSDLLARERGSQESAHLGTMALKAPVGQALAGRFFPVVDSCAIVPSWSQHRTTVASGRCCPRDTSFPSSNQLLGIHANHDSERPAEHRTRVEGCVDYERADSLLIPASSSPLDAHSVTPKITRIRCIAVRASMSMGCQVRSISFAQYCPPHAANYKQ